MTRIDLHVHLVPPLFQEEVDRAGGVGWPGPLPTPDECLRAMDAYEIDASVVSMPLATGFKRGLEPHAARDLARRCNEWFAELVSSFPSRLGAVAVLPLPAIDASLEELRYALDELRLDGVSLLARYGRTYLGDGAYDPLFDELQRRQAYVFVHPGVLVDPLAQYFSAFLLELPFEATRAAMNLLFSGTLARCPDVRMQFANMGGTVPYLAPRVKEAFARYPHAYEAAPDGLDHLRRIYWDTGLSAEAAPIRAALELTDIEHIVFGTDWPLDTTRPKEPGDPTPGLEFLGEDRALIESENAKALVPRLAG